MNTIAKSGEDRLEKTASPFSRRLMSILNKSDQPTKNKIIQQLINYSKKDNKTPSDRFLNKLLGYVNKHHREGFGGWEMIPEEAAERFSPLTGMYRNYFEKPGDNSFFNMGFGRKKTNEEMTTGNLLNEIFNGSAPRNEYTFKDKSLLDRSIRRAKNFENVANNVTAPVNLSEYDLDMMGRHKHAPHYLSLAKKDGNSNPAKDRNLAAAKLKIKELMRKGKGVKRLLAQYKIDEQPFEDLLFTPHLANRNNLAREEVMSTYDRLKKTIDLSSPGFSDKWLEARLFPGKNKEWAKNPLYETVVDASNINPSKGPIGVSQYYVPAKAEEAGAILAKNLPNADSGFMYKGGPPTALQAAKKLRNYTLRDDRMFFSGVPEIAAGYMGKGNPEYLGYVRPAGFADIRKQIADSVRQHKATVTTPVENYYMNNTADFVGAIVSQIKKAAADHPLKSTNIKAVGYDKKEKTMEIEFHSGGTYKYNDVPKSLFDRIKRVKSPGKFFHKHIRKEDEYPFSKLEKESEYKWYMSKPLSERLTAGRPYPFSYLTGEAGELVDAVKNRDWENFKEEIGDTSFGAQMLLAQATGLNHPVYADLSKAWAREKIWKDLFKEKGSSYHPNHMQGGSNYAKPSKIIKALASAGIKVNQREAERLANKYSGGKMEKESAEKMAPPLPHQRKAVEKLLNQDQEGLILMHGLGSGKTRTSIEAYKALGLPAEVIVPAALKGNYEKEIKKWVGKLPKDIAIKSQQEIARKGLKDDLSNKLMIIDEAHRIRNPGSKLYESIAEASPAKRLLLTGTPIYNHPGDLAAVINAASGKELLPKNQANFEERYISQKTIPAPFFQRLLGVTAGQESVLKNKNELKKILNKYIDYYPGSSEGFPEVKEENVNVPMSEEQTKIYKALMGEIPWLLRKKIELGLAPGKQDLSRLMPFLTGARMISNSTAGFEPDPKLIKSPKLEQAVEYLKNKINKDPKYKALVYSNYLGSGVEPYKSYLNKAKIPYGEFTGEIKDSVRNQLIQDYNNNKLKALLISSAGAEGLDLKGTRLVQILEPHFNNEKIKQVIGRAARYKSHEALDPEKRNVLVQRYLSSIPQSFWQKIFGGKSSSTDEYLQSMAQKKEELNKQVINLIKSSEIKAANFRKIPAHIQKLVIQNNKKALSEAGKRGARKRATNTAARKAFREEQKRQRELIRLTSEPTPKKIVKVKPLVEPEEAPVSKEYAKVEINKILDILREGYKK